MDFDHDANQLFVVLADLYFMSQLLETGMQSTDT
jgi:hypothetical protein